METNNKENHQPCCIGDTAIGNKICHMIMSPHHLSLLRLGIALAIVAVVFAFGIRVGQEINRYSEIYHYGNGYKMMNNGGYGYGMNGQTYYDTDDQYRCIVQFRGNQLVAPTTSQKPSVSN